MPTTLGPKTGTQILLDTVYSPIYLSPRINPIPPETNSVFQIQLICLPFSSSGIHSSYTSLAFFFLKYHNPSDVEASYHQSLILSEVVFTAAMHQVEQKDLD